jgi:HAMP domain-containing protein
MNLSLKNRVAFSFIIANIVVLIMGFTVFYFLDSLNQRISQITDSSNKISVVSDEAKISAVSILKMQKKILTTKSNEEDLRRLASLCENFSNQLQKLDSYYTEVDAKKIISKMLGYIDSLETIVSKTALFYRDNAGLSTISELTDKILESFSDFQDIQFYHNEQREKQIRAIIGETRRNMLITLIITFLGTILLSLVIPGKITMPFKKITDAVRELQECNFDVTIYYNQNDEIGDLSREMNKMIQSIKKFEELRTEKIGLENRKFDTLANLVKKNILLTQANGEILYLNSRLYTLLDMQSDDLVHRLYTEVNLPDSIVESLDLAIKRRSKIDNSEISFPRRTKVLDPETNEYVYQELDEPYHGFANVIPIRAKESSSDYYMMIISEEVFV